MTYQHPVYSAAGCEVAYIVNLNVNVFTAGASSNPSRGPRGLWRSFTPVLCISMFRDPERSYNIVCVLEYINHSCLFLDILPLLTCYYRFLTILDHS
jgi:hypothetical protein